MRLFTRFFTLFLIVTLSSCAGVQAPHETGSDPTVVKTDRGWVRGVFRNGALEFRGIPYAASTAGAKRWTLPEPRQPWKGVLDASKFGSACPQVARYNLTEASSDEDCLFVNVSVPEKTVGQAGKLPVFVYIHGGAFVGGGSNLYRLDALARDGGVIVVTMNYRLGVLGFLAHPALERKVFGIEDQRAALRWVQNNIAAFGGDPSRVTVGGESAGAGSTCVHVSSPDQVKGLFHQAIIQSGACTFPVRTFDDSAKTIGVKFASHSKVKCEDPRTALECLRKAPLENLLDAQTEISNQEVLPITVTSMNDSFPSTPEEAFKSGKISRVPILMGGTRDELRLYVGYDVQAGAKITPETLPLAIKKLYGQTELEQKRKVPEKILKKYALKKGDVPAEVLGTIMSDFVPAPGITNCMYHVTARLASKVTPVYMFEFTDRDAPVIGVGIPAQPDPGFVLGAVHSSELNYLFPKLDNTSKINAPDLKPASQKLSEQMISFWGSFIKTGSPKHTGAPAWPKYKNPKHTFRLEPGKLGLFDAGKAHHCDFWKQLYPERL